MFLAVYNTSSLSLTKNSKNLIYSELKAWWC